MLKITLNAITAPSLSNQYKTSDTLMSMPTQTKTTGAISNTGLLLLHPLGVDFVFTHPSFIGDAS